MKTVLITTLLVLGLPWIASARQYRVNTSGRGQVAHTRVAPVMVHRALPPFKGEHVYAGRNK